jgi:hypothetical protein
MHKLLLIGSLLLCCCAVPAVVADDHEDESYILLINHYNVAPEHINEFMAGGEAWKKCYLENGGTETWTIWRRMQGEGITFTFTKPFANWQHFFAGEEAVGEERSKQLQNDFINSVDEMWSYLYAQLPDLSHLPASSGTAQE